jgi:hypothetical protein
VIRLIRSYFRWVASLDREPVPVSYFCEPTPPTAVYEPWYLAPEADRTATVAMPVYRPSLLDFIRAQATEDNQRRAQLADYGYGRLGV